MALHIKTLEIKASTSRIFATLSLGPKAVVNVRLTRAKNFGRETFIGIATYGATGLNVGEHVNEQVVTDDEISDVERAIAESVS